MFEFFIVLNRRFVIFLTLVRCLTTHRHSRDTKLICLKTLKVKRVCMGRNTHTCDEPTKIRDQGWQNFCLPEIRCQIMSVIRFSFHLFSLERLERLLFTAGSKCKKVYFHLELVQRHVIRLQPDHVLTSLQPRGYQTVLGYWPMARTYDSWRHRVSARAWIWLVCHINWWREDRGSWVSFGNWRVCNWRTWCLSTMFFEEREWHHRF